MDAKDESNKLVLREASMEIINSSHIHPFKLRHNYVDPRSGYSIPCILCKAPSRKSYYCEACDFHLCSTCVKKNPLSVDPRKTHEHPLSFLPKFSFVFTCDACGVGDRKSSVCMCIPCCFTIHLGCVSLPRVICINRHEHRISLRLPLGSSSTHHHTCRVCRKDVNGEYGAYSCLTCPDYVVHSKCATDGYVWDGIELDGVPEEDPAEIMPFEVIDELGVIKHFGHEHNLRLTVLEEGDDDTLQKRSKQCFACILPIYSDPFYICTNDDCDFILHEVCANFLKKKRHPANRQRFTLYTFSNYAYDFCECCEGNITGFHYESDCKKIHVICAAFQDGYVHESHPHSELVVLKKSSSAVCSNCERKGKFWRGYCTMGCTKCKDFSLCFRCLTLPKVVEHKYDDKHHLSLCYGESSKSGYWCDICEKSLDPTKWYYTCHEGNSTLHTHCVLGKDLAFRIGSILKESDMEFKVVHNNNVTRPHCHICSSRCQGPILFKFKDLSFCSKKCVQGKWGCRFCNTYVNGEYGLFSCPGCKRSKVLGKG